ILIFRTSQILRRESILNRGVASCFGESVFTTNAADAHYCILAIGTSLTLGTQRIFKIKRNDRVACKLQQKKPQRSNRQCVRGAGKFRAAHLWMLQPNPLLSRLQHAVNQVVCFYAESS